MSAIETKSVPDPDFWDKLTEPQRAAIKNGIVDADNGRLKPYQQVLNKYL